MDQTLKSILGMLEEGSPELKIAACQVIGQLKPKEAAVVAALAERTRGPETFLAPFALDALAQVGNAEAVKHLVAALGDDGAIAERVTHLLGQMGPQVTKALAPIFDEGDAETRSRILSILGRHTDREALTILRKAVLDDDPGTSESAAKVLDEHLDDLDDKQRDLIGDGLAKALSAKSAAQLAPASVGRALLVLGRLDGAKHRAQLLKFSNAKQAPEVRQCALRALTDVPLTPAQLRSLLGYLSEDDMTHVVRPTMQLLESEDEWNAAATDILAGFLDSRSEERRLFALRALRNWHTAQMGKACIKSLLDGPDEFRGVASEALGGNKAALEDLLRVFYAEKNVDRARLIAEPLACLGEYLSLAQRKNLIEKTSKLLTGGEVMGEVYLSLVLDVDAERGMKELVEKAVRLRRAHKLKDCLTILIRLAQSDDVSDEGRYQLAVARLMMDAQEGGHGAQPKETGDATMGYFSGLIRDGFALLDRLKKEGQLTPDSLLHVGRHFATGVANERRFGGELLHFVADKHGRRKVGEEAKLMLRSEGL